MIKEGKTQTMCCVTLINVFLGKIQIHLQSVLKLNAFSVYALNLVLSALLPLYIHTHNKTEDIVVFMTI
jgi:hypothetical protein